MDESPSPGFLEATHPDLRGHHLLLVVSLFIVFLIGLLLVPLGLPGLWLMVLGIIGYGWATGFVSIGASTIAWAVGLAFLGEILEAWVGFRYARKFGGSRRAGWGALLGGFAGALFGVPIPVVGSVVGSFAGSFVGALVVEYLGRSRTATAIGAGWGALLGRIWATAAKTALGLVIVIIGAFAVLTG